MKDRNEPKSHEKTSQTEQKEMPKSIFDRWRDSDEHIAFVHRRCDSYKRDKKT